MRFVLPLNSYLRNNRVASATFYGSFIRLTGMALAFLTGVILARTLGKSGFGIYGIVISAAGIAASAALLGAPYLAVREIANSAGKNDWAKVRYVMRHLAITVFVIALLSAGLVVIALLISGKADPQMVDAAWWVVPFVPAYALAVLMASYLRGLDHPVQAQSVEVLFRPLLLLPPILLVMVRGQGLDAGSAVGLTAGTSLLSLVIGIYWVRSALPALSSGQGRQRGSALVRRSIPFAAIDVLRQLEGAYPLLVLGMVAANDVAGSFRVGQVGAMLIGVPYTVIGQVLSPAMAKVGREPLDEKLLHTSARAMFLIGILGLLAAIALGEPAIALLFGPEYLDAWLPLVILCAVQCVNGFFGVAPILLILAGEEKPILRILAVTVPIAIALAFLLAGRFGSAGAASAVLIGSILSNALAWRHAAVALGVDTSVIGRELRR